MKMQLLMRVTVGLALCAGQLPVMAIADCGVHRTFCAPYVAPAKVIHAPPVKIEPVLLAVFAPLAYYPAVPVSPQFSYPQFSIGALPFGYPAVAGYGGVAGQPGYAPQQGYNGGVPGGVAPGGVAPNGQPPQQQPQQPQAQRQSGPAPSSLQALFTQRCADCHQGDATAAVKGGGQVLLEENGQLVQLSPAEMTMVSFYVQAKTPNGHFCPPKNKLPQNEMDFVANEMERLRTETKARAKEALRKQENPPSPPAVKE